MQGQFPEHIDHLEDFYRSYLETAREPVSEGLWAKIEGQLPLPSEPGTGNGGASSANKPFYQSPYFSGSIALVAVVTALVFFSAPNKKADTPNSSQETPLIKDAKENKAEETNTPLEHPASTTEHEAQHQEHEEAQPERIEPTLADPTTPIETDLPSSPTEITTPAENLPKEDPATSPTNTQVVPETTPNQTQQVGEEGEEQPKVTSKSFYDKLKQQQKDSVRNLFTRKKK